MTKAQRILQAARNHREGRKVVEKAMAINRRLTGRAPSPVRGPARSRTQRGVRAL